MNGDTNGIMGEPMNTVVFNEHNTIPDVKNVNPENLANGVSCENSNDTEIKNLDMELKDSVEAMNTDSAPLENSQGNLTNIPDDLSKTINNTDLGDGTVDSPDRKPINQQDFSDLNNETNSNNGVSEEKVTSEQSLDSKDESMEEEMLCHEVKNSEHSLELSNDININKNNSILEKQENCKNSVDSNNSSDDSSNSEEDTAGDTMSGDDNGKDMGGIIKHKYDDGDSKTETFKIVTIDQHHSDQEVASINLSDYSASDGELKAEYTVSIDSDSGDDSNEASGFNKSNESIIIIENEGTDSQNRTSKTIEVEVHEIVSDNDNDDCVVTSEGKPKTTGYLEIKKKKSSKGLSILKANDNQIELRRSSRAIKRKTYDVDIQPLGDESDVEEVVLEDPLRRKSRHVNSKSFVYTASKQGKTAMNKKKEINVVIIDSPVLEKPSLPPPNKSAANPSIHQNIYQTISSRGTSVTPITVKSTNSQSTQACQTSTPPLPPPPPPPPILPTLTDDMFVVEAPSFIVPYVYEKPAEVPFKEFVDKWGKELAEEKAKEEHAVIEKKKEEKAKLDQEKKEKKERGEEVEESEEEVESEEVKKKKAEKAEKRERRRRKKEDDDVSWDGSSTEESEDESISDEDSQTTILKDKADIIEEIKEIGEIVPDATPKSESYFDLFLGKFFMNIGLNLVQEYVQTDLLNQQKRKLQREKKGGHDTQDRLLSIALLTKNLELSQKTNASLTFPQKKCGFCSFNTESALALAHHLETPHMKNNMYTCNYCPFETRSPHDILFHMEKGHGVKARLERALGSHQCANCPFEDNGKGKLARHIVACTKKFKPEINLAPPAEWEHPAKIAKLSRARQNMVPYQVTSQFGRHHVDGTGFTKVPIPIGNAMAPMYRPRTRVANPRAPMNIPAQMRPSGVLIRQAPSPHPTYPPGNAKKTQPSLSITPLPRQQVPVPVQPLQAANAKGFVICEICDGYIKDLEQLRNHMQWIHKVKIHPKMIYNRPPLNCQKCQFRFFTDQGLERHLLGSHGLVTSSMQEAANKGKDAGRCPVCGRVYQWKLLSHVSRDHNLILKPAHLSYKCTVCTATFGMYRQFENHVYSAHSVVAKKVIDKKTTAPAPKGNANDNAAKQLKINDEITITPQPMKMPAPNKG